MLLVEDLTTPVLGRLSADDVFDLSETCKSFSIPGGMAFGFILLVLVLVLCVALLLITPAGRLPRAVGALAALVREHWKIGIGLLYLLSSFYLWITLDWFPRFFMCHYRPLTWTAFAVVMCVNLGVASMSLVAAVYDALRWLRNDARYFLPRLWNATRAAKAAWDEKWEERIEAEGGFNVFR